MSKKYKETYIFLVSTVYEDEIQFLLYKNGREIAQIKFDDVSEVGKSVNAEEFAEVFNVSADDIKKYLLRVTVFSEFLKNWERCSICTLTGKIPMLKKTEQQK